MDNGINVLSLFDGMSCGQIALNRVGIKVASYFASEIDKWAIQVTQENYPNTQQLGNVTKIDLTTLPKIDLLIGGSPCPGFSISGKKRNFADPRSKLFFSYVEALNYLKPKNFLFENVGSMDNEVRDIITKNLGVEPIQINSSILSAQHRNRYYWTNIPLTKLVSKNVMFTDILESSVDSKYYYSDRVLKRLDLSNIIRAGKAGYKCKGIEVSKCPPIVARHYKGMQSQHYPVIKDILGFRKLTPVECERLQTVPDNYTNYVSDTQKFKMLGNGFTIDVICYLLQGLIIKEDQLC